MNLHFCDVCNESVPEGDLARGEAVERAGRTVCRRCEEAMSKGAEEDAAGGVVAPQAGEAPSAEAVAGQVSGAAAAAAESPAAVRSGAGTAWVALIFAAVMGAVLLDKVGNLEQRTGNLELDLSSRLASLERGRGADASRAVVREQETRATLEAARAALARALADGLAPAQRDAAAALEAVSGLATQQAELERSLTSGSASLRGSVASLRERAAVLEDARELLEKRLAALEEGGVGLARAVAAPTEPAEPEWLDSLEKLQSGEAMVRMEAVYALGESRDVRVAPYLLPLLEDGDSLVCMAVVRILGDLEAKVAVPALIETLAHDHRAVREGAVIALRGITRRSFNFDPAASEEKRKARRDAWRGWWAKDGEEFLAEG